MLDPMRDKNEGTCRVGKGVTPEKLVQKLENTSETKQKQQQQQQL